MSSVGDRARRVADSGSPGLGIEEPPSRSVTIRGWLLPGGGEVVAPTPADPHWRGPDGARLSLGDVLAGQSRDVREELLDRHAEAIAEIVRVGMAAKLAGGPARASVAAASRLIHEIIGQA